MFAQAIETAADFTRPIHIISRFYGSTDIQPGAATLFFVNADGWALKCRHVVQHLIHAEQLANRRQAFQAELQALPATANRKQQRSLERKHGFTKDTLFDVKE